MNRLRRSFRRRKASHCINCGHVNKECFHKEYENLDFSRASTQRQKCQGGDPRGPQNFPQTTEPKLNRHWPVTSLPLRVTPEPLYVNLPPPLPAKAGSYRSRPSSSYPFHWNKGMEETILKISKHEPQSVLNHLDWTKLSQGRHAEPLPPPLSRPNNQNSNDYMNSRNPSTLKCRTLRTTLA